MKQIVFIISILVIPYTSFSQSASPNEFKGIGFGYSSYSEAMKTCPFMDSNRPNPADDRLSEEIHSLTKNIKAQGESTCSRTIISSLEGLTEKLANIKKDNFQDGKIKNPADKDESLDETGSQSKPSEEEAFGGGFDSGSMDNSQSGGSKPDESANFSAGNEQGQADLALGCELNPKGCIADLKNIITSIKNGSCKARTGDLLSIATDVSLKLAAITGNTATMGVGVAASLVGLTLDLIKDVKTGKMSRYINKLTLSKQEEKLRQLSLCFAFNIREKSKCNNEEGIYIVNKHPRVNTLGALGEHDQISPNKVVAENGEVINKSTDLESAGNKEAFTQLNDINKAYQGGDDSRMQEHIATSNPYDKISDYAEEYITEKINNGKSELKDIFSSILKNNKKAKSKKYAEFDIVKVKTEAPLFIYKNLISNCYNGYPFVVGDQVSPEGQRRWYEQCGSLNKCIGKLESAKRANNEYYKLKSKEVRAMIRSNDTHSVSVDNRLMPDCHMFFDHFDEPNFLSPKVFRSIDNQINNRSMCIGQKLIYDVSRGDNLNEVSKKLKLIGFDGDQSCDSDLLKNSEYDKQIGEQEAKLQLIRCKQAIIKLKDEKVSKKGAAVQKSQ